MTYGQEWCTIVLSARHSDGQVIYIGEMAMKKVLVFALLLFCCMSSGRVAMAEDKQYIIVDPLRNTLSLMQGEVMVKFYRIRSGRPGFKWYGDAYIDRKALKPDWNPPPKMIARELLENNRVIPTHVAGGDPSNPLGVAALYLSDANKVKTEYRIHGTNDASSIGRHVSSGCFGLNNADMLDLYNRVKVGTPVIVVKPDQAS